MSVGRIYRNRGTRPRFGAWLAILALLCQAVAGILPLPAFAGDLEPSPFNGGYVLCHTETPDGDSAPSPDKAPPLHGPDCGYCAAIQHLGGFAPPAAPELVPPVATAADVPAGRLAAIAARAPERAHQPRAPPSFI